MRQLAAAVSLASIVLPAATSHAAMPPVDASVVRERMSAQRETYRRTADVLSVGAVTLDRTRVPAFERLEAQFTLAATYANPFDCAEIQVDGIVTRPDGRTVVVPAFFCVPHEPTQGQTQMTQNVAYRPAGAAGWRLRYAPDIPGEFRLVIRARDASGRQAESAAAAFRAEPSTRKGFVRPATGNPMFFENSADGSLFWPVGANVAYTRTDEQKKGAKGPPTYEHYFGRARGKMNATRVWLCHWAWLEWTPQQPTHVWPQYAGAGYYNQMIAAGLDRVFALAEAQGLRIMLVTEDNNEFSKTESAAGGWTAHPYNRANGGPCAEPEDFFTSAEARQLYRNRLRYIAARWGYSEALWAINSCNDYSNPTAAQLSWLRDVRDHVHGLFEGWRPIIYGSNFRFQADEISDYRQASLGRVAPGKPNVVQECYYSREPASFRPELHEQLWAGLGRGLAGIMVWDHVLVDRTDAWDEFLPLMRFVDDLPLHRHEWRPLDARVLAAHADAAGPWQRAVVLRSYGDVPDWGSRPPRNRFDVSLRESHQWLEGYSRTLFGGGAKSKDWRNPPTFVLNLPANGKLLVELSEFSGRAATLVVSRRRDDRDTWREAASAQLANGRRLVTAQEKWLEVPLSAGRQEVMLDARGDWIRTERIAVLQPVADAASLVDLTGWTDGRHAFLILQNQTRSRLLAEVLHQAEIPLRDLQLELGGLSDGAYDIEVWDTTSGTCVSRREGVSANGRLPLRLVSLNGDAAVKIVPR